MALLLLAAGLGVRWLYVRAVAFPPLDDPAFYLTSAGNLASGRGLVVDALWSYQMPFPGVTHPSHEHWMPLTTGLIASAFALLGQSLRTGQLPGMILGALLAPFTYLVGRRALPGGPGNRRVAFSAALLVAISATLSYQSASADSSAPFALIAAGALLMASPVGAQPSRSLRPSGTGRAALLQGRGCAARYRAVITGLLAGLAYLTRSDGLLLLAAIPLAWWLLPAPASASSGAGGRDGHARPGLADLVVMILAFALLIAPWLARNYLAFGTPLPGSVLSQARISDYAESFNYQSFPTWETVFARGWQALLLERLQALLHNGSVWLLSTFPWGLLALPAIWLLRRERIYSVPFTYGLLLFVITAIGFPVSAEAGTFYHSLGAIAPFLALATTSTVQRASQYLGRAHKLAQPLFVGIITGLVVLAGAQMILTLPTIRKAHREVQEQFETVAAWLAQNAAPGSVIMTTQPYTLNYTSGYPAIVLPSKESPDAAWAAAQRYGARFLVITQDFGRYPGILHEHPDPRFRLLDSSEGIEIYAIGGGQP